MRASTTPIVFPTSAMSWPEGRRSPKRRIQHRMPGDGGEEHDFAAIDYAARDGRQRESPRFPAGASDIRGEQGIGRGREGVKVMAIRPKARLYCILVAATRWTRSIGLKGKSRGPALQTAFPRDQPARGRRAGCRPRLSTRPWYYRPLRTGPERRRDGGPSAVRA